MKPTESKTSFQHVDDEGWVTFTDKLIGLEVCSHRIGAGDSDVHSVDGNVVAHVGDITTFCHVLPVEHVPALIRKLVAFAASGNIAIAHAALVEAEQKKTG